MRPLFRTKEINMSGQRLVEISETNNSISLPGSLLGISQREVEKFAVALIADLLFQVPIQHP